jgi:transcriptional regulator with XRE-family HTH domain
MENPIYAHVAQKIRELRERFGGTGLSQEQLAEKIGVTPNTVSRWETTTYKPKLEDLDKLAKFFSVPIYAFLPVNFHPEKPELNALFSATADLKKEDIEALTEFAQFRKTRRILEDAKKSKK